MVMEVFKALRVPLACAVTAAFALIVLAGAPVVPVIAGCTISLLYLLLRSWSRLSSQKQSH